MGLHLKLCALAAVVVGLGLFYWHYDHLRTEAAKVEGLETALNKERDLAQENLETTISNYENERQTQQDLIDFTELKNDIIGALRSEFRNSQVATNPVCYPTDAERGLFNAAVRVVTGRDAAGVPALPSSEPVPDDGN